MHPHLQLLGLLNSFCYIVNMLTDGTPHTITYARKWRKLQCVEALKCSKFIKNFKRSCSNAFLVKTGVRNSINVYPPLCCSVENKSGEILHTFKIQNSILSRNRSFKWSLKTTKYTQATQNTNQRTELSIASKHYT